MLVVFWGLVFFILYIPLLVTRKNRDNCLTWALRKWDHEGGYLVIRWARSNRSRWILWPHFLWLHPEKHHHLEHVISEKEEEHLIPEVWFEPVHIKGDDVIE